MDSNTPRAMRKTRKATLGDLAQQLYVTRAATVEYQRLTGAQFETARLSLTLRLLDAEPDEGGSYVVDFEHPEYTHIRAYIKHDKPPLAVVTKIVAL